MWEKGFKMLTKTEHSDASYRKKMFEAPFSVAISHLSGEDCHWSLAIQWHSYERFLGSISVPVSNDR